MDEPLITNLGDGLARLIQRLAWPLLRAQDIRAARNNDPQRRTFHLWFADGRELKGRYCISARFGRAAARIRELANMEFLPAVVAQEDDVMLEQWIQGQTLAHGALNPDSIRECGRMLGRLHQFTAPSPAELDLKEVNVSSWAGMMTHGLGNLAAANVLTETQSRRLEELARSHKPKNQAFGIVNRDMRPENIVADPGGRLFLVDNGLLTVGLVEEDLCRTWYLWPMTSDQRRAFSSGYSQFADPAGFENPSLFWRIVVVANSASFRLAVSPAAAAAALARLDDVIASGFVKAFVELTRTFDFRGLSIQVHSNILAPLRWLEEFMSPSLCSGEQIEIQKEIRLSIDEDRYAQMLAATQSAPPRLIDTFTMDGSFEQFTAHAEPGWRENLHFPPGECFVIPETDGTIELVARADQALLRRCLMRLLRELAMIQALHRGDVFLHGAAVVCRGQAILICGARRAGKTSMLINALRQPGIRFLSNDRLFIQRNENPCIVRGMPTIIAIRPDSFGHLPGLKPPQWGFEYRHYLTMRECEQKSPLMQPPYQVPPSMNPPQFCKWLGVETAVKAPLRAVIFPTIDQTAGNFALKRQSSEPAESLLAANIFWSGDSGPVAEAFARGWPAPGPNLQDLKIGCREVSRQCAVMTCQIGPTAFGSPNVWDAIVSAVFEDQ